MAASDATLTEIFSHAAAGYNCTVSMTRDLLKGYITALPIPGHQPPTIQELLDLLLAKLAPETIERGVVKEVVAELAEGKPVTKRLVARGHAPGAGRDGRVVFLVKAFRDPSTLKPEELRSQSSLHLFDNIRKDQVVARVHPPALGEPGIGVDGSKISGATGKQLVAEWDASLIVRPCPGHEYSEVVAARSGILQQTDGTWEIAEVLNLRGGLGREHGSVDCIGAVSIDGDVAPGLAVRANKSVTIKGLIRDSLIESREEHVEIGGHAFGAEGGAVKAHGNVTLRSAERLRIEAGGSVTIQREARLCELVAGGGLLADAAHVVGGTSLVQGECSVGILGNDAGLHTGLTLTASYTASEERKRLDAAVAEHNKVLGMLELHLGPYGHQPARIQLLREPFRGKMEQLHAKLQAVKQSLVGLQRELAAVTEKAKPLDLATFIVERMLYSGVEVTVEDFLWKVLDNVVGPTQISIDRLNKTATPGAKPKQTKTKGTKP